MNASLSVNKHAQTTRLTLAQINPTIGDFDANTSRITRIIEEQQETNVFIFPELAISGYMLYDYAEYKSIVDIQHSYVERIAKSLTHSQSAIVGGIGTSNNTYTNCAFIIAHDRVQATQKKCALPTNEVFFETRYFAAGAAPTVHTVSGLKIACFICYDLWHKEQVLEFAKKNVDCIVWIAASPYTTKKHAQRLFLAHEAVSIIKAPLFMANAVGANDEIVFDGQSFVMNKDGALVHTCALCEEDAQHFEINTASTVRHLTPAATGEVKNSNVRTYVVPRRSPYTKKTAFLKLSRETATEILTVLTLGLKDYIRKTGMLPRVHLGLSGGIDSAVTAAIAVRALGAGAVTGILLPSQYTCSQSVKDAQSLAGALNIDTHTLPIEAIFKSAHREFYTILENNTFGVMEENMQARIRGMLLMAYANKCNSMLLTTGNKSEVAVGYCTLYGDMCGALNLIGDLYKTEVYVLAEVINEDAEKVIINDAIMHKAPTAELRENQKDSDSLPEYPTLDTILYEFVENCRTPEQLCNDAQFKDKCETVRRVWHLLKTSEYKRYQAAPIIKISERPFGRGRIMPIAARV